MSEVKDHIKMGGPANISGNMISRMMDEHIFAQISAVHTALSCIVDAMRRNDDPEIEEMQARAIIELAMNTLENILGECSYLSSKLKISH